MCFIYDFYLDRNPNKEIWFHAAAVWDKAMNKAYLYLDGTVVGTSNGPSGFDPTEFKYTFYDIGLKRDANHTMKGYLRNLMIVRSALTGEEIFRMKGTTN